MVLMFTSDDDFHRLCSVEFQIVDLCPFFNVVKFGNTRLSVTGQYKDVGVVCIFMYSIRLPWVTVFKSPALMT